MEREREEAISVSSAQVRHTRCQRFEAMGDVIQKVRDNQIVSANKMILPAQAKLLYQASTCENPSKSVAQ